MHRAGALWKKYLHVLQIHPWRTWSLQTGAIMGTGDVLSQMLVDKKRSDELDRIRTVRFAAMGMFFVGPAIRGWYLILEKMFGTSLIAGTAIKKMLADQFFFAPLFLGNFMVLMGLIQQQPFPKVWEKLNQEYLDVLKANYLIWPAVQSMNFYVVPLQHRLLVINGTMLMAYSYLMWLCNKPCLECPIKAHGTSAVYIQDDSDSIEFRKRMRSNGVCSPYVVCREVPFPYVRSVGVNSEYEHAQQEDKKVVNSNERTEEKKTRESKRFKERKAERKEESSSDRIKNFLPKLGTVANNVLFRKNKADQLEYDECCRLIKPQSFSENEERMLVPIQDDPGNVAKSLEKKESWSCVMPKDECLKLQSQENITFPVIDRNVPVECPPPVTECLSINLCSSPVKQSPSTTKQFSSARNCLPASSQRKSTAKECKRPPNAKCIGKPTCPRDNVPREIPICTCNKKAKENQIQQNSRQPAFICLEDKQKSVKRCLENGCSCITNKKSEELMHVSEPQEVTVDDNSWPLVSKVWWILKHPFRPAECIKRSKSVPECPPCSKLQAFKNNAQRILLRKSSTTSPVNICPQPRSQVCTCNSRPVKECPPPPPICTCKPKPKPSPPICTCKPKPTCTCPRPKCPKPCPPPTCIKKPTCPVPICTQRPSCPAVDCCSTLVMPAPCIHKSTCPQPPPPPEPARCPPLKQECIRKKTCPQDPCIKKPTCPPPPVYPVDCKDFCFRVKEAFVSNVSPPKPEESIIVPICSDFAEPEKLILPYSVEIPPINIKIDNLDTNLPPFKFAVPPTTVEFTHPQQEFQVYSLLLPQTGASTPSVSTAHTTPVTASTPSVITAHTTPVTASPSANFPSTTSGAGEMSAISSPCYEDTEINVSVTTVVTDKIPETNSNAECPTQLPSSPPQPQTDPCEEGLKTEPKIEIEKASKVPCVFFVQEPSPISSIYYESQSPGTSERVNGSSSLNTLTNEMIFEPFDNPFSSEGEIFLQPEELPLEPSEYLFQESDTSFETLDNDIEFDEQYLNETAPPVVLYDDSQASVPSNYSEVPDALPLPCDKETPPNLVAQKPAPIPLLYAEEQVSSDSNNTSINDSLLVELAEPELVEPELAEPELAEPELAESELAEPELAEPELAEPESAEPESEVTNEHPYIQIAQLEPLEQYGPVAVSTTPGSQICTFPVSTNSPTQIHLTVSLSAPGGNRIPIKLQFPLPSSNSLTPSLASPPPTPPCTPPTPEPLTPTATSESPMLSVSSMLSSANSTDAKNSATRKQSYCKSKLIDAPDD